MSLASSPWDADLNSELGVSLRQLGLWHPEEVPLRLEPVIEFLAGLAASPLEQLKGFLPDSLESVSHLLGKEGRRGFIVFDRIFLLRIECYGLGRGRLFRWLEVAKIPGQVVNANPPQILVGFNP
jgi:hypothetical protein